MDYKQDTHLWQRKSDDRRYIQIQRFVARRTYEATLDDAPGLVDDRHRHRLARAGPPRTTARS